MDLAKVTLTAKAHNGKISVNTEIAVPSSNEDYLVTINIVPQKSSTLATLDSLYGALADDPLPEIADDLPFEQREVFEA